MMNKCKFEASNGNAVVPMADRSGTYEDKDAYTHLPYPILVDHVDDDDELSKAGAIIDHGDAADLDISTERLPRKHRDGTEMHVSKCGNKAIR
jgi:hypothetical protein